MLKNRKSFSIFEPDHPIFIEGHRGVNREFYQNTLESFSQAINYNLDSIELDVWLTKDKIPVVIHGGKKGQLSEHIKGVDKKLLVSEITFEDLQKLRTVERDQQIPSLESVLDLCKNKIFINIEIKDNNYIGVFNEVVKLLEKKEMFDQIAMSSFFHKVFDLIQDYNKKGGKQIEFGYLYRDSKEKEVFKPYRFDTKGCSMNIYQKDVTKEIIQKAHDNGIKVMAWFKMKDKENEEIYKKLFDCGIDVICSNEPNKAKEFRDFVYKK